MKYTISVLLLLFASFAGAATWKSEGPWLGFIYEIAVDPTSPDTLYAATHGGGVWKSVDGGATWQLTGSKLASTVVHWVRVDPRNPKHLYAGVDGAGLARSKDGGATWSWVDLGHADPPSRISFATGKSKEYLFADVNLHHRSADGTTWKEFRVPGGDVNVFVYHPTNPKIVWACGTDDNVGLSRSDDGGTTWKQIGSGLRDSNRVRDLLVDPSNPDTLYMKASRGVHKSVDGGKTWTTIGGGEIEPDDELEALALAPSSPETLYAATKTALFKSTDGGETWSDVDYGLPSYVIETIAVHPTNPNVVWVGAGSVGVWKTTDGAKTWKPANDGLAASWVERVWGDASGAMFAQTSSGLYRRDGATWTEIRKPFSSDRKADLDVLVFDRKMPRTIHAGDYATYYRSIDGGKTWTEPAKPFQEPTPMFSSLVVEVGDARTMYSGSGGKEAPVFKSVDGGVKWKPSGKGLPTGVSMLRSEAPRVVLAMTKEHGIWRTADGAVTWTATTGAPTKGILELVIDPAAPERAFAVTETALYASTDGGVTWTAVPSAPKKDVTSVAVAGGAVFVGTNDGVHRSSDGGKTWTKEESGLSNPDVRALYGHGRRLYAGTAGGGVFTLDVD